MGNKGIGGGHDAGNGAGNGEVRGHDARRGLSDRRDFRCDGRLDRAPDGRRNGAHNVESRATIQPLSHGPDYDQR